VAPATLYEPAEHAAQLALLLLQAWKRPAGQGKHSNSVAAGAHASDPTNDSLHDVKVPPPASVMTVSPLALSSDHEISESQLPPPAVTV